MQAKLKPCNGSCNGALKVIWKNFEGNKYCQQCWNRIRAKDLPLPKPRVKQPAIKGVSISRMAQLTVYRIRRDLYFKDHPVCEFFGCTSTNITLHHKKGRTGKLLTDDRFFCSLCVEHHLWVETHPKEAQEMGLSLKRLNNDT